MSGIKHRTLVHIALNAKGERVGLLVSTGGKLLSFGGEISLSKFRNESPKNWLSDLYTSTDSLSRWKRVRRLAMLAVRFQRVMLVGGEV